MVHTAFMRLVLENFQNILLSSISEVYKLSISSYIRLWLVFISYGFITSCAVFYVIMIYKFHTMKICVKQKYHSYGEEFFSGLKEKNTS